MLIRNIITVSMFSILFGHQVYAEETTASPMSQPTVNGRMLICDQWQWIGNGNTLWGCLWTPREASVAHGLTTDQVIVSLQDQINKLEARIKKLETP